jgi:hypothetical protein
MALDRYHVASNDAGVLQQLLCQSVETLSAGDEGVRDGQEDDLNKLDTDDLDVLACESEG